MDNIYSHDTLLLFEDHVSLSFQKNSLDDSRSNFIDHWSERQDTAVLQGAAHEELNDIIRIVKGIDLNDALDLYRNGTIAIKWNKWRTPTNNLRQKD